MKTFLAYIRRPFVFLYNKTHWFTDKEAWGVYRFAAFVEAGFWGFFILTIIYALFDFPIAEPVLKYGRLIWETAFGVYVIFVLVAARSMEWGVGTITLAIIAGLPPFGSVVFERIVGKWRTDHPRHIAPPSHLEDE